MKNKKVRTRRSRVRESVYTTPKIFGAEYENSWRSGVRSFTFTSVGASRKNTCSRFNLFLESYLWRGKVKFGMICNLGVTFNNDWRIFGVRFTQIPPWNRGKGSLKNRQRKFYFSKCRARWKHVYLSLIPVLIDLIFNALFAVFEGTILSFECQSVPVPRAIEFKMATGCKFLSLTDSRLWIFRHVCLRQLLWLTNQQRARTLFPKISAQKLILRESFRFPPLHKYVNYYHCKYSSMKLIRYKIKRCASKI